MGRVITQDLSNLRAGEDDVLRVLEDGLPDDWDIACTLAIPAGEDSRELDVVAIGPSGVYVVEVKHHAGHLDLSSSSLTRSGRHLENPYYQVEGAAKVLADYLRRKSPDFGQIRGKPVHAHIVLSNLDARLIRIEDEISHQVSTLDTVVEDLRARDDAAGQDLRAARERLRNVLATSSSRDAVPPRIFSYNLRERLSTSGSTRTFTSVHDDGSEYLLRLLRPKNTRDAAYAKRERDGLLREYETLRRLSDLDVCPTVLPYQELDDGEFLIPIQAPEGRSLAQEITDGVAPDGGRVTDVVGAAYRALAIVHEAGVVHRSITPERVVITPNGTVVFTDFQVAHIDEKTGLTTVLADIDPDDEQNQYWRAPEARQNLAYSTSHSDVWALATSLKAWVVESMRSGDLKKHTLPGEVRARIGTEVADQFSELLRDARADSAGERPSAREIADRWGPVEPAESIESSEPVDQGEEQEVDAPPLCRQELTPGDTIAGRYELVEELGAGSTAVTYLVRDVEVGEHVVLKSFDFDRVPESLALQEFKKAKSLVHERIATVREYHRPEHPFHLVVDHAPGRELQQQLERFVGDADAVVSLAEGLLGGLAYIHDKGYLHRDVSPRNVIVADEDPGDVKLIDFGLAALSSDTSPRSMGTFGYAAPEVVQGEDWTTAADVYSAGVVLYQALTGDWPFRMERAPVHDDLQDPPAGFGPHVQALAGLLLVAVQPDPAARYPDAGEFLAALHEQSEEPEGLEDKDATMAAEDLDRRPPAAAPEESRPTSSWLTGLSTLEEDTDDEPAVVRELPPPAVRRASEVSEPGPEDESLSSPPVAGSVSPSSEPDLKVAWFPEKPVRPTGNTTFGIGRIRKYSLGLDGTVRGVLAASGRERTVYASVPDEFVAMVNAAKRAGGQSEGGTLVIDHEGHVLVGTMAGVWLAGQIDGTLMFEDGSRVVTPAPDEELEPGSLWEGLRVGLRYKLNASTSDVAYESVSGGWVWLSDHLGRQDAHLVASAMGRVKPGGGRFYVNEAGAAFGPVQVGQEWREVYLGCVTPDAWFSSIHRTH